MKKNGLTIVLAVLAVVAIVVGCVFGVQKGNLQKTVDSVKADLTAKTSELETANAATESVKAELETVTKDLETARADLEASKAELETKLAESAKTAEDTLAAARAELQSKVDELEAAGKELQGKVDELEAAKADLEGQLAQAGRNLTAALSNAYIMYASADWSVQNWGTADAEDGSVKVTPAKVEGPGDYTVGLEFANEVSGLAFTAIGIKNGEIDFPGYFIKLNEIRINGEKIETGVGYTSSDDGKEIRMNIYNEWVSDLPSDARVYNGDIASAKPVIVDKEAFAAVKTVEMDFSVLSGPEDTAYIMYADGSWDKQFWLDGQEHAGVTATTAKIDGYGDYTVGLTFEEEAKDVAFTALGIKRGEITFPKSYITIKEIRVNGEKISLKEGTKAYTSSDDGTETRVNLYNEWVGEIPEDARRLDGDLEGAAAVVVDKEAFASVKSFEVDFNVSPVSAYVMFANEDWSVQNWGYESSDAVTVIPTMLTGEGSYTTGLEFAEPQNGLAFAALGVKNGEAVLPGYILKINSILVNGETEILKGIGYTSSDDGKETRSNIYNEWVAAVPDDARADGSLENASAIIIDKDTFKDVKSLFVTFDLIKGKEVAAAAASDALTREQADEMKANGFNAYIGVQSKSYIFRNEWNEKNYGRDSESNPGFFDRLTGWDADGNAVDYGGTFADAKITGDGEYTVKLTTGEMGFGTDSAFNLLFVSTEIPSQLVKDGFLTISDVKVKIGSAATKDYTDVDTSGDYAFIKVLDSYNYSEEPFGYTVPGAGEEISITFTVSGW